MWFAPITFCSFCGAFRSLEAWGIFLHMSVGRRLLDDRVEVGFLSLIAVPLTEEFGYVFVPYATPPFMTTP